MAIYKMTEREAKDECGRHLLDFELNGGELVRLCAHCMAYVFVDDYSGETKVNGVCQHDICDDCREKLKNGEEITEDWSLKPNYYAEDEEEKDDFPNWMEYGADSEEW